MKKPKRLHEMSEEERIKHSDEYAVRESERQRLEFTGEKKKTKLYTIRLHLEDQVKGNYTLMTSGPVQHVGPPHTYLISEEQLRLLEKEGIRYTEVD